MLSSSDSALLDAVRGVRWPARRRSPAGLAGNHLSRVLGASAEFTEYRAYRPGDEVRRIDWKLLARSNRAYIRLSHQRTVLSTVLVVDASGSLAYPAASLEKWQFARHVTLGLAAAAHHGGDPVGLVAATADGPRRLPPRTRRGVVYELARVLAGVQPAGSPGLAPLLSALGRTGRVAIISDFLGDADALLTAAGQLAAAGREVHAIHVLHAHELDPPRKVTLLTDPENPDVKRPSTEVTRRRYLADFGAWREALARRWRLAGAHYSAVATTEAAARAVRRVTTPRATIAPGIAEGASAGVGAGRPAR